MADQLPPSERLNIGFVGVGGKGGANIKGCKSQNIYSLCDVDSLTAQKVGDRFEKANVYDDWRVMLDKDGDALDAVVVTTPDHNHAVITMGAMQLGKAVYTEKPLTRTISEARILTEYANKNKIISQMGNQGHSNSQARMAVEWIRSGLLGDIREVHCWTNRPIWPQDSVRPASEPVPDHMNWDVWLGPAKENTYSNQIAPFKWRSGIMAQGLLAIWAHTLWITPSGRLD